MENTRFAWGVARGLVWTGGLVVAAAALVSTVAPVEIERSGRAPSSEIAGGDGTQSECETTTVRMQVADGQPNAHYSLCDEEGKEVVRVMYNRQGRVAVTWGDRFSVRAGCWATPGGAYDMTVRQGEVEYRFEARPGVASGFSVANHQTNERDGLGVTPEGWIVRGFSIIE